MDRRVYYRGATGKKYGIWNSVKKCFQFNICEDTPMLAEARLYQRLGDDARKWRFSPRELPAVPEKTEKRAIYVEDLAVMIRDDPDIKGSNFARVMRYMKECPTATKGEV